MHGLLRRRGTLLRGFAIASAMSHRQFGPDRRGHQIQHHTTQSFNF